MNDKTKVGKWISIAKSKCSNNHSSTATSTPKFSGKGKAKKMKCEPRGPHPTSYTENAEKGAKFRLNHTKGACKSMLKLKFLLTITLDLLRTHPREKSEPVYKQIRTFLTPPISTPPPTLPLTLQGNQLWKTLLSSLPAQG